MTLSARTPDRHRSSPPPASPPATGRLHFLDGLRGTLMLVGIPYHSAFALSGRPWVVTSDQESVGLQVLTVFLHLWRMPAFFLVAGFFAVLVLRRRPPGRWFRGRLERLGVPLVFGLLLVNPAQVLVRARSELGSWTGALADWGPRLVASDLLHLWFLRDLLVYCAVLALVVASPWRSRLARAVDGATARLMTSPWLRLAAAAGAGVLVMVALAAWRLSGVGTLTGAVLTNQVLLDVPFFLAGAALAVRPGRLRQLAARSLLPPLLLAACCLACLVPVELGLLAGRPLPTAAVDAAAVVAAVVGGLAGAVVVLGLALRHGDRDSVATRWVVDSSLVVYLLHHVVVVALAALLLPTQVLPLLAFPLVVAVTLVLSVLAYEVVNGTPGLRYLMTGRRSRATGLVDVLRARRAPAGVV